MDGRKPWVVQRINNSPLGLWGGFSFQPVSHVNFTGYGFHKSQQSFHERGFSRAVFTDDGKIITGVYFKIQVAYNSNVVISDAKIFT